jgi:hypothetical protein
MRRQFNMAFFKQLLLSDEGEIMAELAEPFDLILGEELRRAAVSQAEHKLGTAINETLCKRTDYKEQHPQEPDTTLVGAAPPALLRRGGFSPTMMVRERGLEPPRPCEH